MSKQEADAGAIFTKLERAAGKLVERVRRLEAELESHKEKQAELEAALARFTGDKEAPSRMIERAKELEVENRLVRERLEGAGAVVERLLARLRFLEERR